MGSFTPDWLKRRVAMHVLARVNSASHAVHHLSHEVIVTR